MADNLFDKEEKFAKKLLKKYPFLKKMWQEREKIFGETHRKEVLIENKYNKIAKKVGLKSVNSSTTPIRLTSFTQGCSERSRRTLTTDAERIPTNVGVSRSVKFAYNEYCFGIDVNDVDAHGAT